MNAPRGSFSSASPSSVSGSVWTASSAACSRALALGAALLLAASAACEPGAPPKVEAVAPTATTATPPASGSGSAQPPASDSGAPPAEAARTLFVKEGVVDCEGEVPMKCMQVRGSASEAWTLFYGKIEGFTHDPAFTYELRVTVTKVAKPPADARSQRYHLVEIVSKNPAPAGK